MAIKFGFLILGLFHEIINVNHFVSFQAVHQIGAKATSEK